MIVHAETYRIRDYEYRRGFAPVESDGCLRGKAGRCGDGEEGADSLRATQSLAGPAPILQPARATCFPFFTTRLSCASACRHVENDVETTLGSELGTAGSKWGLFAFFVCVEC
jgi:hypothetical protein